MGSLDAYVRQQGIHHEVIVPGTPQHNVVVERINCNDRYCMTYKKITLSYISFMFIEMKFIHCHSCVMFAMKFMSICND